jgi:hypothetical protein
MSEKDYEEGNTVGALPRFNRANDLLDRAMKALDAEQQVREQ